MTPARGPEPAGRAANRRARMARRRPHARCPRPSNGRRPAALAQPKSGWVSLKDFSSVVYNNQHIVYMSTVDSAGVYGLATTTFTDWPQMATATQTPLPYGGVAPTLIYFTPKNIWVLMYEWGPWAFTYQTSTIPPIATGWQGPHKLYRRSLDRRNGPVHQHDLLSVLRERRRNHPPGIDGDRRLPGRLHQLRRPS